MKTKPLFIFLLSLFFFQPAFADNPECPNTAALKTIPMTRAGIRVDKKGWYAYNPTPNKYSTNFDYFFSVLVGFVQDEKAAIARGNESLEVLTANGGTYMTDKTGKLIWVCVYPARNGAVGLAFTPPIPFPF